MQPPSPAVSHENELYNTNSPIASPMTIVRIRVHMLLILVTNSIQERHLLQSATTVQRLFEGGNYSKKNTVIPTTYIYMQSILGTHPI